jgi:hypothetical protein
MSNKIYCIAAGPGEAIPIRAIQVFAESLWCYRSCIYTNNAYNCQRILVIASESNNI